MPRPTLVDTKARAEKAIADLTKLFHKELRRLGAHVGETRTHSEGNVHSIEIENNLGGFAEEMQYRVNKHEHAQYVGHWEHKGHFDWAADVYIKDCSIVSFKI